MALNQLNRNFQEYPKMIKDFERRPKANMGDDFMCNRFINGMAYVSLMTYAMSHRIKPLLSYKIF
jgi:hypothetical protein